MKIYDCKIAPSTRRVRIFLAEKGVAVEMIEVDVLNAENLRPAYQAINPRGLVPTLQLDDGTCIDEAVAICRYLETLYPEPPLMGTDPKSIAVIESRNRHMELDGFVPVTEVFRNITPSFAGRSIQGVAEGVPQVPQLEARGRAGLRRYYDALESWLASHAYVAGDDYTIADITALTVIDFAGWVSENIPETHANVRRWYQAVSTRPSAQA